MRLCTAPLIASLLTAGPASAREVTLAPPAAPLADPRPIAVAPGPRVFEPPACADDPAGAGWLTVKLGEQCDALRQVFVAPALALPEATATVHADSDVVEAEGAELAGAALLVVRGGAVAARTACVSSPCTLPIRTSLRRALAAGEARVLALPAAIVLTDGSLPRAHTAEGWRELADLAALEVRFEIQGSLFTATRVDATVEPALLPVAYPDLVSGVRCRGARCALAPEGVRVFAIERTALTVRVTLDLVPAATRREEGRPVRSETRELELTRCALRAPPAPLLAGVADHRFVIAIARDCHRGGVEGLSVESRPPANVWISGELPSPDEDWRLLDVVFERAPERAERVRLTVLRRAPQATALGAVEARVADGFRPTVVRLSAPALGPIDFLPSNVEARAAVVFDDPAWEDSIRLTGRSGYYDVGEAGTVQAVEGATGHVALRFAYTPPAVAELAGKPVALATFESGATYALRTINVPVPLREPFVRLLCQRDGEPFDVARGRVESVSWDERNGCQLLVDRDALSPSVGAQRLRFQADGLDEVVLIEPRGGPLAIALPADSRKEFDPLKVSVSHEYGGGHYDFAPRQNLGAGARYRVVLGESPVRVSASTSLPTGLFRFGADADQGAVPLSAGAIGRVALLYKEGAEFPIGYELGIFGTGLSGEPNLSFVSGIGFSVPVLNADTPLQTSFNLHAWLEYSPTREGPGSSPWAFLFGPSFAVGKFSANL